MRVIMLSDEFYRDYGRFKEVLQKENRPYCCISVCVNGVPFAIPFRHHITHRHSFLTIGDAWLDFSKAVVVHNKKYISTEVPTIESKEFAIIKKNENKIKGAFIIYLNRYRRAAKDKTKRRNKDIVEYSTLQYFEDYLRRVK